MQGLYLVSFKTPLGNGIGVLIGDAGSAFGGDANYAYRGTFAVNGNQVSAKLKINQHTPGDVSVFGNLESFDLNLEGSAQSLKFTGTSPQVAGVQIDVTLTKAPSGNDVAGWQRMYSELLKGIRI